MSDTRHLLLNAILKNFKKFSCYIKLWGFYLTVFKVLGRTAFSPRIFFPSFRQNILVIGCGQFAYSTLAPRLVRYHLFSPIRYAYDPSDNALQSFCRAFACNGISPLTIKKNLSSAVRIAYICSDHASHFEYLMQVLEQGVDAYCEKPVTTTPSQVYQLAEILGHSKARFYAGYNRPHSPHMARVRAMYGSTMPDTVFLGFNIYGHFLESDHWYRDKGQGSRIYGNVAHWVDLVIHVLFWQDVQPDRLDVSISYLDDNAVDENIVVRINDGKSFHAQIGFYCLMEPFTGVHEYLEFATNKFTARINNFISLEIDTGAGLELFRTRKKSAGHSQAIRQPMHSAIRPYMEVLLSELLLGDLHDMVQCRSLSSVFPLGEHRSRLAASLRT